MSRKEVSMIKVTLYHQTVYDVFGDNSDLNETCFENIELKLQFRSFPYHKDYSISEILHDYARTEIIALLKTEKDFLALSKISDIAIAYSKEWEKYSTDKIDSSKVDSVLSQLSEEKVEFTLRRYYYLQDKHQILGEMKLEDNEFEKMKEEIELSFQCNTLSLVELMKGLYLGYLTEYNEKIYSELAYLGDDTEYDVNAWLQNDDDDRKLSSFTVQQKHIEDSSNDLVFYFIAMGVFFLIYLIFNYLL